jgi:hypothetical protein
MVIPLLALASLAHAGPAACDGLKGPDQLRCFKQHAPDVHDRVEAACANAEKVRDCRVSAYAREGLTFTPAGTRGPGNTGGDAAPRARLKPLNPTAVTVATVTLTLAGTTMSQAPGLCASNPKCTLTAEEQATIAAFGGVIATEGARIPAILGTQRSDAAKTAELLGVLQGIIQKAPTGLGPAGQVYVTTAIAAAQAVMNSIETGT